MYCVDLFSFCIIIDKYKIISQLFELHQTFKAVLSHILIHCSSLNVTLLPYYLSTLQCANFLFYLNFINGSVDTIFFSKIFESLLQNVIMNHNSGS